MICKEKHYAGNGYSKNGYNSYQISGLPDKPMRSPDMAYFHSDGIIPFKPLDEIEIPLDEPTRSYLEERNRLHTVKFKGLERISICKTCQNRYDKLFQTAIPAQ